MRFANIGCVAVIGILGLAACSNNAEAPAGEAGTGAKGGDSAPAMLEGPKPGKWRITTAMTGMPGGVAIPPTEICVTEAVLEAPVGAGQTEGAECSVTPYSREGDVTVATSTCKMAGNMTATSAVRIIGDFNSRYVTEVTTKMDPAPAPNMAETKMTITSERIGDC